MYHNVRLLLLLLMSLALAGCLQSLPKFGSSKKTAAGDKAAAPVQEKSEPTLVEKDRPLPRPKASVVTQPTGNHNAKPAKVPSCNHLAVLLPLKSNAFAASAEVVWQGMQAARGAQTGGKPLPLKLYSMSDEAGVSEVYQQAEQVGACAVAGPITRDGVQVLLKQRKITKPTLVLNNVESVVNGPVYGFGLSVESEARQIAQLMSQHQLKQAMVIVSNGAVYKRLQQAFASEWQGLGGQLLESVEFVEDRAVLDGLELTADTGVFLATDATKARWIKPYLPKMVPVYATSMLFTGNQQTLVNHDLEGVVFVDMPWLLMPEDPVVSSFPRAASALPTNRDRLYALGVDAWQLLWILHTNSLKTALPLVGVSGDVNLVGQNFERQVIPAMFKAGKAVLLSSPTEVGGE